MARAQSARQTSGLLSCLLLTFAGCVEVDGGSVSFSWAVQRADGRSVGCGCAGIQAVALVVKRTDSNAADPCAGHEGCMFDCERKQGSTPFIIPAGRYSISVAPLGSEGQVLTGRVSEPAPILRDVEYGQPTDLDAFQLVANCHCEENSPDCPAG